MQPYDGAAFFGAVFPPGLTLDPPPGQATSLRNRTTDEPGMSLPPNSLTPDPRPTLQAPDDDPHLWLEEIDGERALAWVEAQNADTLAAYADGRYAADPASRALFRAVLHEATYEVQYQYQDLSLGAASATIGLQYLPPGSLFAEAVQYSFDTAGLSSGQALTSLHRTTNRALQFNNGTTYGTGRRAWGLASFDLDLSDALHAEDVLQARGADLIEIANSYPTGNSADATYRGTEALWDQVLTNGMRIYGTASDDTHDVSVGSPTPPGLGWVQVAAAERSASSICQGLKNGRFYASTGVELTLVMVVGARLRLQIQRTPGTTSDAYETTFVGAGGRTLAQVRGVRGAPDAAARRG